MKISGVFKFYQNGELIGEAENSLTQIGRVLAIKTLMGAIPNFGTSIGVGVDSTDNPAAVSGLIPSNRLGFKTASAPVIATNIDNDVSYDVILFKAKITDSLYYKIHEVGLFSDPLLAGASTYRDELVLGFENSDNLYSTVQNKYLTDDSYSLANNAPYLTKLKSNDAYKDTFRIGTTALVLRNTLDQSSSPEVITTNSFVGLDRYDDLDLISLGVYCSTSGVTVSVRFYTNDSAYKTYQFTGLASGYNVKSLELGAGTTVGSFDWNNVTKVGIFKGTSGVAVCDGVKIENVNPLDTNRGMVSRAKLPSAITKLANIPVDIEYSLRIGFNG